MPNPKCGKESNLWVDGRSKLPDYNKNRKREYRHRIGMSKLYKEQIIGLPKRLHRKLYKARRKSAGPLTRETLQLVYEDNIKQYGTLTCIYCIKPIVFGNDTLEHKIPIVRGGTNEYSNLGIACRSCNCRKRTRTVEEFKREG